MKLKHSLQNCLALLSGALLTLAFAPFNLFPIAVLSPALLLCLWLNNTAKRAFWLGLTYGLGFFSTGVYWIYISVHTYGNTSAPIALLITGGLIAILALFPALNGYFLNRFFHKSNSAKILCAFPAMWVFLEWVRTWIFSGFPWLLIGYSQLNSPLRGYASLLSVYGVSLMVLLSSGLLVNTLLKIKNKMAYFNLLALAFIWILGSLLSSITWTTPVKAPVKVSLVQGNIAENLKWSPDQIQPTLDRYLELTEPHWDSQIVIWPESAIPLPLDYATDFLDSLKQRAITHKDTVITGIPIRAANHEGFFNAVIALGYGSGVYTKHRLVPFGEYIPLRKVLGHVMDLLQVPMSDFIPGAELPKPIMANDIRIATFICYEIAYPQQVLMRDGNIDMLLTVSNDAWFGHSIAQAQHLQIAQMRALEMGRPILFVSNDGITAIINSHGEIQSQAPTHVSYVLTDSVQLDEGKTPWQRFAMYPIFSIVILIFLIAFFRRNSQ